MTTASISAIQLDAPTPARRNNLLALIVAMFVFSTFSLWGAFKSEGFLEGDSITHYMMARHSINEPHNLTSVWGRPLCTGLYTLPAYFGKVIGVRIASLTMALACGLICYRIARLRKWSMPALAPILLFAQPLFYLHSFSELTEIPFAFMAMLAFWAFCKKQFFWMTICVSLTPMGRPEGIGLICMAIVGLIAHRRWYYIALIPIPLIIWSYAGWSLTGKSGVWYLWLKANWPYALKSMYGSGPWWHFILLLPVLISPIIFPSLVFGIWQIARSTFRKVNGQLLLTIDHNARIDFLIAFIPLSILFVHSVLWILGAMGSNGELRYLLCIAPLWALLCAFGWQWVWQRYRMPAPFLIAGVAALMPILANVYYQVVPLKLYEDNILGKRFADFYASNTSLQNDFPRVVSTLPMVFLSMDLSQGDHKRSGYWGPDLVKNPPPGCVLIWDEVYGLHNASDKLCIPKEVIEKNGWLYAGNMVEGGKWMNIYLSPTTTDDKPTDPTKYAIPETKS